MALSELPLFLLLLESLDLLSLDFVSLDLVSLFELLASVDEDLLELDDEDGVEAEELLLDFEVDGLDALLGLELVEVEDEPDLAAGVEAAVAVGLAVAPDAGVALVAGVAVPIGVAEAVALAAGVAEAAGATVAVAEVAGVAVGAVWPATPDCVVTPLRPPPIPMLTPTAGCTP